MIIGVACRSTQHFNATIDHMIHDNCLNKDDIIKRTRDEVFTGKAIFSPIYVNRKDFNRGVRYDLIIPEVNFYKIMESEAFRQRESARLRY